MRVTYKAGLSLLLAALVPVLWLAAVAPAITPAMAQQDEDPATENKRQLMLFAANNTAFDARVEDEARNLFRRQIDGCTTTDQVVRQLPTPYGNIIFPANRDGVYNAPLNGLWVEHVKARGCGKIWQINILAVARQKSPPMLLALLPGETLADPASQRSAERSGATAIKKADNSCADDARAAYTRILGFRQADGTLGKTDVGQGWFEEWTFRFCQKTVPVQVAFLLNTAGGFDIRTRLVDANAPRTPEAKPDRPAAETPAPQAKQPQG